MFQISSVILFYTSPYLHITGYINWQHWLQKESRAEFSDWLRPLKLPAISRAGNTFGGKKRTIMLFLKYAIKTPGKRIDLIRKYHIMPLVTSLVDETFNVFHLDICCWLMGEQETFFPPIAETYKGTKTLFTKSLWRTDSPFVSSGEVQRENGGFWSWSPPLSRQWLKSQRWISLCKGKHTALTNYTVITQLISQRCCLSEDSR